MSATAPDPQIACRESCDGEWLEVGAARVQQCRRCRRVLAVVNQAPRPLSPGALDALQATDGRPAEGWPGCID